MKSNALLLTGALGAFTPWFATAATDPMTASVVPTGTVAMAGYTDGELKKIDAEQGKIRLKHGPIDNLGMPGMTMVFRADTALVSGFKPGDLVKFKADREDGAFKVTELVAR